MNIWKKFQTTQILETLEYWLHVRALCRSQKVHFWKNALFFWLASRILKLQRMSPSILWISHQITGRSEILIPNSNWSILFKLCVGSTDYGHTMAKSLILCSPNSNSKIPIPKNYLGFGYKGLVFCRNNGWLMKNMDKGLTVQKWVLINQQKIPQMLYKAF